ncbi:hypothetical protein D9758_014165 [Tetrapyrgos nigripes]|uniref:Uncharacterized protein n=1 Tax=Tetrapyrgos nigripes TaxID=182062 RepID=A0A8H5FNI0_9AGAR|nr:hypothetical protein D9758_014165 [Tetrapyrgos nigripes]
MMLTYQLDHTLKGHTGTIQCMAVTEDGRYLASGANDGTVIWDLQTMSIVKQISSNEVRDATTAVLWIKRQDTLEEGLIYGTGKVACIEMAQPSEVTSLAYDSSTTRLVATNREGVVALFVVDPTTMKVSEDKWAIQVNNSIPKSVLFDNRRDVVVFGMHDAIYKLDGANGLSSDQSLVHGTRIGYGTCDSTKTVYCIDDITSGCTLYRMTDGSKIQDFKVPRERKAGQPKQVAFGESCKVIVSGSDHGNVYVFDRRSGELLQTLSTGTKSRIHGLTTFTLNGTEYIAAGELGTSELETTIFICKKTRVGRFDSGRIHAALRGLGWMVQALILIAASIAIYQNYGGSVTATGWGRSLRAEGGPGEAQTALVRAVLETTGSLSAVMPTLTTSLATHMKAPETRLSGVAMQRETSPASASAF